MVQKKKSRAAPEISYTVYVATTFDKEQISLNIPLIVKCPSDVWFRISPKAVGQPGTIHLLFYKYYKFVHITHFTYFFSSIY